MSNVAQKIIIPTEPYIFKIIFLYVGQGDSTLLVVPKGENYEYILIDSNVDESCGGINLIKLLSDLFKETDHKLNLFINTHPHSDHLKGIKAIYDKIGIDYIWHSGHVPGKDHEDSYNELKYVIDKLDDDNVFCLKGSSEENKIDDSIIHLGDIIYNILAPAEYVADEIENEKPEERYNRIHEQCGAIRFRYGKEEKQVLITGDADYNAWKDHITDYHEKRLPSLVLSAAHHGSNSFFWKDCDTSDDSFVKHIETIKPTYIVVSAPKVKESRHDHPHDEAMELYAKHVGKDNLFHLGAKRECIIMNINSEGEVNLYPDDELVQEYGFKSDDKDDDDDGDKKVAPAVLTGLDKKPFGIQ